jgi:hypothetical protein
VLIVTLFIGTLFGMILYYYMNLASQQRTLVARSQAWNAALSMAEAGAEEVLAHLDPGVGPQIVIDRAADGWGSPVGGLYGPADRTVPCGSYSVVFTDDAFPVIYSTGYVSVASIPATLTRVVKVTTTNAPVFSAALAAKLNIDFSGNGVFTDSFDSSNPLLSDNGRYPVLYPTRTSTNGDVASVGGLVNVGNGKINGQLLLGPTASDAIGANGLVTGGIYNDFNVEFPDVVLPQVNWLPAATTNLTIDGVTYQYVFTGPGGYYSINGLSGSIYVGTNASATLLLTGNASPPYIRVAGMGLNAGKLTIYMDGPTFSVSGGSSADGGLASSLGYWGTTNNTRINYSGNAAFTGTIYAPEAFFKISGGGSTIYNFVGAVVVQSAQVNGHFAFHFDQALLRYGPIRAYLPASWTEL